MRIRLFPNIFAVIYCQAQYKMPYVLRRKTTAHLSCAITALFQRCVPGFHSDAFFLDFYMTRLDGHAGRKVVRGQQRVVPETVIVLHDRARHPLEPTPPSRFICVTAAGGMVDSVCVCLHPCRPQGFELQWCIHARVLVCSDSIVGGTVTKSTCVKG